MKVIRTVPNQTIFDIAVKYYGNAEATGEIVTNNPGLRNDPAALAGLDIDYVADGAFYADAALLPGQEVRIATDSSNLKQTVIKELKTKEINTFDL